MLPKVNRIHLPAQFDHVFKTGRKIHNASFMVIATRNNLGVARFGFIVNKKVGNSVVRHATVRQLREAVRETIIPAAGFDIVIVGKPLLADGVPRDQVVQQIAKLVVRF